MPVNFLDHLTQEQRDMIVSLPYRVGLCISQSDDSGGNDSDAAEARALENLLTSFSQEVFSSETVQYVISETVRRKSDWPKWARHVDTVEGDCNQAIDILSDHVDPKEISAFKNYLVEIGESVAMAFREYGANTPFMEKMKMKWMYSKCKAQAEKLKRSYKSYDEFLNISLTERKALQGIARALGTVYI